MKNHWRQSQGQSLLEVVVALAVVLIVIVGLVWAVITAVKSVDFAKKKAQATSYAQEGMEKMRAYRDASRLSFFSLANGTTYGLSGSTPDGGCPSTPNLGSIFTRCVKLELEGEKVKTTVTVSWVDNSGTHTSKMISYFTSWQTATLTPTPTPTATPIPTATPTP